MKPSGRYVQEDLHAVGGTSGFMKYMLDKGFLDGDCLTCTGKTLAEAHALFENVHKLLTEQDAPVPASLGKLAALSGVREFPARVKCASLCWHTLNAALAAPAPAPVSTE